MAQDYNATINLPKTEFPMRANLPKREPGMIARWQEEEQYKNLMEKNEGKPLFVLHDGPPFSNGDIHMGTAMNKVLKDFIVRYKNMTGFKAPYIPGWDNHGMPIESAIIKKNKLDRKKMSVSEFRDACRAFAADFVQKQMESFIRLGVIGDWEHPYLTMDPSFEAEEVRVFGKMYEQGYIYKGLKPVYWCPHDETALAEAEIEYADDPCESVYVKFAVNDDLGKLSGKYDISNTYFVIWTTTPWTLPGNLAICVGPEFEYAFIKVSSGEVYIMAKELAEGVLKLAGIEEYEVLETVKGEYFENMKARHPFYDRDSVLLLGEHVTLEAGTGCVHTAPGHGVDDYNICCKYGMQDFIVVLDDRGIVAEDIGKFAGMYYSKADAAIIEELENSGKLLVKQSIVHQYPHCWRCKKPIVFRATEQWFASVNPIKETAVESCEGIEWLPEWGKERMIAMIRERSDWCISRQRNWGLPIPVFYCKDCGKPVCTQETIDAVSKLFAAEGSNAWFEKEASDILPGGFGCPHCGKTEFDKETDTLDGWFDSGSTHAAVVAKRPEIRYPADMYLEGGDQYRGWFQSSMLTSIATNGIAPYKNIITHGWTVDGEGKKMSKSVGNVIVPSDLIPTYGSDILRLWVSSADYKVDVRISKEIFKQLSEAYLKIRNTARYILGNLNGFDPKNKVEFKDMQELDKWALIKLNGLVERVRNAYDSYEFHGVYRAIYNFCVVDMSNFYLDIIKDRLYCDGTESVSRRSAQTAIYIILDSMVRMIAPILAFTSDEIWRAMPHDEAADVRGVIFNDFPEVNPEYTWGEKSENYWSKIQRLRTDVNKALEKARSEIGLGKSLDAEVTLFFDKNGWAEFEECQDADLAMLFICSGVNIVQGDGEGHKGENFEGVTVKVQPSEHGKCVRCWMHAASVGQDEEHTELCGRCAQVVKSES